MAQVAAGMTGFADLAARLTQHAARIALARAETRRLAQSDPAVRWRKPGLLWPRFTKG
ncbi:MAG: hypothetical protein Q8Q53_03905 [Novosphingobium sp.]|nr:hypothetical protein [Novosphingobium sp.]